MSVSQSRASSSATASKNACVRVCVLCAVRHVYVFKNRRAAVCAACMMPDHGCHACIYIHTCMHTQMHTDLDSGGEEGQVDVVHDGEEAEEELGDAKHRQEDRQRLLGYVVGCGVWSLVGGRWG